MRIFLLKLVTCLENASINSVCVNCVIHVLLYTINHCEILAFDLRVEEFSIITLFHDVRPYINTETGCRPFLILYIYHQDWEFSISKGLSRLSISTF